MARPIKEFPRARRTGKYPWDQWLDGQVWLLRRGEDYKTSTPSMRAIAAKAAKSAGMSLKTRLASDEDGTEALAIQAIEDQDGP